MLNEWQIKTIVNYLVEHPIGDSLRQAVEPFIEYEYRNGIQTNRVRTNSKYRLGYFIEFYRFAIDREIEKLKNQTFFRSTLNNNKVLMIEVLKITKDQNFWLPDRPAMAEELMMRWFINWSDVNNVEGGRTYLRQWVRRTIDKLL